MSEYNMFQKYKKFLKWQNILLVINEILYFYLMSGVNDVKSGE